VAEGSRSLGASLRLASPDWLRRAARPLTGQSVAVNLALCPHLGHIIFLERSLLQCGISWTFAHLAHDSMFH
jgi:hypothetical protein